MSFQTIYVCRRKSPLNVAIPDLINLFVDSCENRVIWHCVLGLGLYASLLRQLLENVQLLHQRQHWNAFRPECMICRDNFCFSGRVCYNCLFLAERIQREVGVGAYKKHSTTRSRLRIVFPCVVSVGEKPQLAIIKGVPHKTFHENIPTGFQVRNKSVQSNIALY